MRQPSDLDKSGKALWRAVVKLYDLEPHHALALASACRCADMVARLEDLLAGSLLVMGSVGQVRLDPAVAELRQHRLALSKLLVDLALPAETVAELARPSAASRQASKAASVRWNRAKRLGA
jgi:hypothetical protein